MVDLEENPPTFPGLADSHRGSPLAKNSQVGIYEDVIYASDL